MLVRAKILTLFAHLVQGEGEPVLKLPTMCFNAFLCIFGANFVQVKELVRATIYTFCTSGTGRG